VADSDSADGGRAAAHLSVYGDVPWSYEKERSNLLMVVVLAKAGQKTRTG
jgi:hypothetical protein